MFQLKKIILSLLLFASVSNAEFFDDLKKWALEAVPEKEHHENDINVATTTTSTPEIEKPTQVIPATPTGTEPAHINEVVQHSIEPTPVTGEVITRTPTKKIKRIISRAPVVVEVDVSDKLPIEFVNTYGYKVATAYPDSFIINEDSQITFNPVLNDVFYKADDYRIISIGQVKNAGIELRGNEITVLPYKDYYGKIEFDYVISSKDNKTLTSVVSIEVMPINDRPIAKDDLILTQEDVQMVLPSLTANDIDGDNDNLEVIHVSQPSNGSISEDAGVWLYTPKENFYGIERVSYTIRDENGAIDKGLITLIVKGVNDTPSATDDNYTTNEDSKIQITDYMSNDVDVDGDLFHLTGHTTPAYGVITYNGKSLTYTPEKDFNGKDYFYYTIADTKRKTSKGKITIQVIAQNDEPITKSDGPFETEVSKPLYITSVMDNDSDVDGDELSISTYTRPLNGEVSFDENQTFVYIPNPGFLGIDRFTYTVSDGQNTSDVSTIEILVKESAITQKKELLKAELENNEKSSSSENEEDSEENDILNALRNF